MWSVLVSSPGDVCGLAGRAGELGIYAPHAADHASGLSSHALKKKKTVAKVHFVAGGLLGSSNCVTVLSTRLYAASWMKKKGSNAAKLAAEEAVKSRRTDIDLARAASELTEWLYLRWRHCANTDKAVVCDERVAENQGLCRRAFYGLIRVSFSQDSVRQLVGLLFAPASLKEVPL
jgi:F0F1-type ATP synthase epsilon subunit